MFLWGSSFVAMKYGFLQMHPFLIIWGRMLVASVCFVPFLRFFQRRHINRRQLLLVLLMCLCEPCLYFLFETAALQYTSASQAAMITSMLPLLVALSATAFLGERLSPPMVSGFFLAAAGACWLSVGAVSTVTAPHPAIGNMLEFIAMLCATAYTILIKQLSKDLHPFLLTGIQAVVGTLFFLPVFFLPAVRASSWNVEGLLIIIFLGAVVSLGAYGLYNYGLSSLPAGQASVFINLIPVFSLLMGRWCLREQLTTMQWYACGLVFLGVVVSQRGIKKVIP